MNYKCVGRASDIEWTNQSIWLYPSEIDRLEYDRAPTGKTLSAYIIDKVYSYGDKIPEKVDRDKSVKGNVKSLCFPMDKWQAVKARAESCGMKITQYVVNILFEK